MRANQCLHRIDHIRFDSHPLFVKAVLDLAAIAVRVSRDFGELEWDGRGWDGMGGSEMSGSRPAAGMVSEDGAWGLLGMVARYVRRGSPGGCKTSQSR